MTVGARGLDQAEDPAAGRGTCFGIGEEEVLPGDGDRLGDMLGGDVEIGMRPSVQ